MTVTTRSANDINAKQTIEQKLSELERRLLQLVGPWLPPETLSAKLEKSTTEGRAELTSSLFRLQGTATVKTANTVKAGDELFKLSPALRPSVERHVDAMNASTGLSYRITVYPTGQVLWFGVEAGAGSVLSFDGTVWTP
jgi:hypothetical protein